MVGVEHQAHLFEGDHSQERLHIARIRQEQPDLSAYDDREIVKRIPKSHHAGLIVRSPDFRRVEALLDSYVSRFAADFLATMPAPDRPVE